MQPEFGDSERVPGLDLLDGRPGPALPLDEAATRALVGRALAQAGVGRRSFALLRFRRVPVLSLGIVAATTAAAAAFHQGWSVPWFGAPPEESAAPAPVAAPARRARARKPTPAAAPAPAPPVVAEPEPNVVPEVAAPVAPRAAVRSPRPSAPTRAARSAPRVRPVSEPRAADVLSRANALRGDRRYAEALKLYSSVVQGYPHSLQAHAARIAAAALRLEHFGDVGGAERLYREAAAVGGELAAEAEFGLIDVLRARGKVDEERRALREFLDAHPESPLTAVARRRLGEPSP